MYSYQWDEQTGGYVLLTAPLNFSKEPRPVYYQELDILEFDKKGWNYLKDDSYPYMWAESNSYYYRGKLVAKTRGGSLYTKPEVILLQDPEENGQPLRFVDIKTMIEKNSEIMEILVNQTIKKVYNTYVEYQDKVDLFYVAFSGGKDSIVLLDIVQKALPHNTFKVVFGDTQMEFPDTYEVVREIEKLCEDENIDFLVAKSHIDSLSSWDLLGPPSQTMRWCCSVHKTTPQIIKIRETLHKNKFTGMAFIGVRRDESISRSEYDYVSLGEKHKGQYSCNPIIEWNAAEVFLYIYQNSLILNKAYYKGNSRAGCLVCPMAAFKNEFFKACSYNTETERFINAIKTNNGKDLSSPTRIKEYLETGGWKARRNGRELNAREIKYSEYIEGNYIVISVNNPNTSWKEWMSTIGSFNGQKPYRVMHKNKSHKFELRETENGYDVLILAETNKTDPYFMKLFRQVFRKAAYCVLCRTCEANCNNGVLDLSGHDVAFKAPCIGCSECHKIDKGCLVYKSLLLPKGEINMSTRSINCYSNHGPKMEWITSYFKLENSFIIEHKLGSNMFDFFKRFLRDADLLEKGKFEFTDFASVIKNLGFLNEDSWGLILANLSMTPQIRWYIKNIKLNNKYVREEIINMLNEDGVNNTAAGQMILAYKRFLELPFGKVGLGVVEGSGNKLEIARTAWLNPSAKVLLYSLYKFAEALEQYQFTLSRVMDFVIESDAVSPAEIYGLDRNSFERILNGLSINYPEFISASFTLNLDNITLKSEKTSLDVLDLFRGE